LYPTEKCSFFNAFCFFHPSRAVLRHIVYPAHQSVERNLMTQASVNMAYSVARAQNLNDWQNRIVRFMLTLKINKRNTYLLAPARP